MKIMLFITFNAFNLTLFLLSALVVNRFDFKDLSDHEALPLHEVQEEKGVGAKASAFQYASHRIGLSAKIKIY